jgi:hypothetical protein
MQAERRISILVATAAIVGGVLAGTIAVAPNVYHDVSYQAATKTLTTVASATTPTASPDVYHDV